MDMNARMKVVLFVCFYNTNLYYKTTFYVYSELQIKGEFKNNSENFY